MAKNKGDLFNIDNIEEAIKAIEEIYNIIQKTGVSAQQWMNDNEEIVKKYNELKKLSSDLFKQDEMAVNARNQKFKNEIEKYHQQIKFREEQIEQEVQLRTEVEKRLNAHREIINSQKEEQQIQKDAFKYQKQLLNEMKSYKIEQPSFSLNNLLSKKQNTLNNDKSKRSEELISDWISKNGNLNENDYDDAKKYVQTKLNDEFGKRTLGLSVAAQGLQTAGNLLKEAANTVIKEFKRGLSNQTGTYENTFTNISVRAGVTRDQYYDNQWNLNNRLSNMGLNDNIRSSDVQKMWNSLANTGMDEKDMFANAIDNVVTQKIVPYLDTTSQSVNLLNNRLDGSFVKDIRGINQANLEIAGNNYATQDLLNTIIDKVQPMSDEALQNLALGSSEITSFVNTLIGKGYDKDTAVSYATKYFQAQEYGDQMLSSGSTADRIFMSDIMSNPQYNLYDLADAPNIMAMYGNRALQFANEMGGYNSSISGLETNIVAHTLGYSYKDFSNAYKLIKNGETFSDIANDATLSPDQVTAYSNKATSEFTSGQNQTTMELQSITVENFMNELAVTYEKLGLVGDVFVSAIESLGKLLITWFGTNLVGKLFGGTGSGLLGNIGNKIKGSALGTGISYAGAGNLIKSGTVIAGGTALGLNGVNNVISDVSSGNVDTGTGISTVQGVAGLGAAGVATGAGISAGVAAAGTGAGLGASIGAGITAAATNPVGWALLAVAGVAAAGKAAWDAAHNYEAAGDIVESQYNNVKQTLDEEITTKENTLYNIKESLKDEQNVEDARQKLLESGILTEQDMQKAQEANISGLNDLTDQYIQSTKDFSDAANNIIDEYSEKNQDEANKTTKSIKDWYEKNKNIKNDTNSDIMKNMVYDTVNVLKQKDSLSDDEQWFLDEFYKNTSKGKTSQQDWEWLLDKGSNLSVVFNNVSGENLSNLSKNMKNRGANIQTYDYDDPNMVANYLTSLSQAQSKDEAEEILQQAKQAGLSKDKYHQIGEAMDKWGIDSYRQGINDVPADQLAYLHQGEAVLTASTANELRNMTDTYRETTTQSANIDAIIQNQTSALITKMDEIIRAILTGTTGTTGNNVNTSNTKLWNSMINIQSTKNF